MQGRLEGKVAVITGAASGIGRATAELFIKEGARVLAADIQEDKGARLQEEYGNRIRFLRCDVLKESDIKGAIETAASTFGRLDILFNNAGSPGAIETVEAVTTESFDNVMHMHVLAALLGIKHAIPFMRENGGSIISTASIAGLQNGFGPILYSVAKSSIIHMTKLAAAQLGPHKIRVNCICPGLIATPIFAVGMGLATQVADQTVRTAETAFDRSQPIPRTGMPRDIAEAALFLASDTSTFVNGHALVVDGGITVGPTGERELGVYAPLIAALASELQNASVSL